MTTIQQIDEAQGEITQSAVQYERKFLVKSDSTIEEKDALEAIDSYLVTNHLKKIGDAIIKSISVKVRENSENRVWEVGVTWNKSASGKNNPDFPKQDLGIIKEQFSVSEERQVSKYGFRTVSYSRSGYTASNFGGIIGQDGNGVEISVPAFSFSIERRFDYNQVTDAVKQSWAMMVGTVNSAVFRGFGVGTVKFVGMSGRTTIEYDGTLIEVQEGGETRTYQKATAYYDVTFNFQAKPNEPNHDACGIVVNKPAWSHVWLETQKLDDPNSGRTIDYPIAANVTIVCDSRDFSVFLQ